MAYFPEQIMPKVIREETSYEVDNSPLIYNARDRNIHHREIIAIEKYLAGSGWAIGTAGGGIAGILQQLLSILKMPMFQICGSIIVPQNDSATIDLPSDVIKTETNAAGLAPDDTTITVTSTSGFPDTGWITKFNSISASTNTSTARYYKDYAFAVDKRTISSQEVISYSNKTSTQFLGCIRDAATAQDISPGATAIVVCGKACLGLSPIAFNNADGKSVRQFYVEHNANLAVKAGLYQSGSMALSPLGSVTIMYDLSIVGAFGNIDLSILAG